MVNCQIGSTWWASFLVLTRVVLLISGPIGFLASEANALTIKDAVRIAISTHPDVRGAVAVENAGQQQILDDRSDFFPTIDGKAESGLAHTNNSSTRGRSSRPNGGQAGVTTLHNLGELRATQKIFDGFDTTSRVKAAENRGNAARFSLIDTTEATALRAVDAFLEVNRLREFVRLAEENFAAHVELVEDAKFSSEGGQGQGADVFQAQSREALSKARLREIRGQLRRAEADYNEVIGSFPETLDPAIPDSNEMSQSLDDALALAIKNSPVLNSKRSESFAARDDIETSKSSFWPTLDLELTSRRQQNTGGTRGPSLSHQGLFVLQCNFFSGGRDRARYNRSIKLAERASQEEASVRRLVEEQIRFDYANYQTAADRLPLLKTRVVASSEVVDGYEVQFTIGRRTLLDVLDVKNELFQAKIGLIDGFTQLKRIQFQFHATLGQLLKVLGLSQTDINYENDANNSGKPK